MGLLKRARSVQGASRSDRPFSGGLLRKSLDFLETIVHTQKEPDLSVDQAEMPAPPSETLSEEQRWERFWTGLRELEHGIEYPARLFALIKEYLQMNRCALLLYDPLRMAFAPWAFHGFDETTKHRLRIPLRANDTMNRLASGSVHLLSNPEELKPFHQFFSFREFSTLSNLLLVPFIHESRFMGLLLSTDCEQTDLQPFDTLGKRAARELYAARERHLEGLKRDVPPQPDSLQETVAAALKPHLDQGLSPLLIRISSTALVASVQKRNPYIDAYRLTQDISRVILSLFQSLGSVFQVDRERMLILVSNQAQPVQTGDPELLLHHLKTTLGRLLPELADAEQLRLDEQVRIPGPDIEEVFTQLAEIV